MKLCKFTLLIAGTLSVLHSSAGAQEDIATLSDELFDNEATAAQWKRVE